MGFTNIPSNILVPGAYIEVDPNAGTQVGGTQQSILVVAQALSSGTWPVLTPTLITSLPQASTYFGAGSMITNMIASIFANNTTSSLWACSLADVSGGTAASGTITVTGPSTAAGTLSLYMGGVLIAVSVASGDSATTIATAIKNAINANINLLVTATSSAGVVTVTFNHKGLVGNSYDMQLNYLGATAGEVTPAGVALVFVALANGATDPTVSSVFAVLPDQIFNYMVFPYTGSTNLNAIDTELASRWLSTRMLEGHAFVASGGTVSTVGTLGQARNSQHMCLFDTGNGSPTPWCLWAAAVCAVVAVSGSDDPGRPFTGLTLTGILPEPLANRRTQSDNETLLHDGVATHSVNASSVVAIQRMVTCYQLNTAGSPDDTYQALNTLLILSYLRQNLISTLSTRFARCKLADNGTVISPGQATVTPNLISGQIVANAINWSAAGLIQNLSAFVNSISVTRNANDPSRVDCYLYPKLINQLEVIAIALEFSI